MSEARFQGKVVQITGAASGFGALAARRFAAEGARLALSDRDGEKLAALAGALDAEVLHAELDVSDAAAQAAHARAIAARFGRLDVAVNNAGVGHHMAPLHKLPPEEFDRMMAVNARGVFLGMQQQITLMLAGAGGAILNVASAAGIVGAGHLSAYAASKHAVVGLTRAAADEVAKKGIRVNAICPSFAATPLFDEMADAVATRHGASRDEASTRIAARVPMGRVARPEEVVQAMLWICDPANSFMTGQAIAIDGGLSAI
ncbi:short-chain dehydrogenase [Defluviimonas sp. 20V17]|uniref:3-oxoacyl-ACP reductase n=1 Tax=Allgaiera indica TaxID=765699 RepID=A0AAN4UUB6_9RHOB|nr:glucose 1-dehydrogenase [Allgaiera indica]KDB05221.1 short-chain dehydrogenase [Defluviimonas sp. 20V17]GHE04960.1 3-oxoacyl-ACP reductase [Allgaiera indica]SDX60260.1 NAD(P)-dependent dehydrogenase, short-chain alcohol dehydrogenase family [Allgaiera indica]